MGYLPKYLWIISPEFKKDPYEANHFDGNVMLIEHFLADKVEVFSSMCFLILELNITGSNGFSSVQAAKKFMSGDHRCAAANCLWVSRFAPLTWMFQWKKGQQQKKQVLFSSQFENHDVERYSDTWGSILESQPLSPSKLTELGGGNSNIFYFSSLPGEMIQFDEHMFQMGWNHQLEKLHRKTLQKTYTSKFDVSWEVFIYSKWCS